MKIFLYLQLIIQLQEIMKVHYREQTIYAI